MRFISSRDTALGQNDLLADLQGALAKGQVLYLLSGGSAIQVEIAVLSKLESKLTANLKMLLVDERFGPKGHPQSNYAQLVSSGLDIKQANFPDILEDNLSQEETADRFSKTYQQFKSQSDYIIGQLGIGDDGHIAGVLPNSPGVNSVQTVVYYESSPYKRLSLSLKTLKDVDKTYVFCFGPNKKPALERLREGQETIESLPALFLKEMTDVTVYNDQV